MSMEKYKKVRHVTRYSPFRYTICYTLHDTPLLLHDMLPVTRYSTFVTRYVTRYTIFPFSYTMCYPSHDIPPFLLDTLNVTRYSILVSVVYQIFVSSLSILETSCKIVKMSLFIHLKCQSVTSSPPLSSSLRSILDSRQWLERNAENHIKTKPNLWVTLSHPHYEAKIPWKSLVVNLAIRLAWKSVGKFVHSNHQQRWFVPVWNYKKSTQTMKKFERQTSCFFFFFKGVTTMLWRLNGGKVSHPCL